MAWPSELMGTIDVPTPISQAVRGVRGVRVAPEEDTMTTSPGRDHRLEWLDQPLGSNTAERSAPLVAGARRLDADRACHTLAPRRRRQGDGLYAEALRRLRPLPRRRPHLHDEQCRRKSAARYRDDGVILHPFFKCLKTLTSDLDMKGDAGLSSVPGRGRRSLNGGPRLRSAKALRERVAWRVPSARTRTPLPTHRSAAGCSSPLQYGVLLRFQMSR